MTENIVHEATHPFPPADVRRALTTPAAMGAWLTETTFQEATVGHRFEFRDKPKKVVGWNGVTRCEVPEVVPERRFVIRFGDGEQGFAPTRVVWELEPAPEGTRVRLRHEGFMGLKGWLMRQGMNQGWGAIVRHAVPFVATAMARGAMPTREETRAASKAGFRADHRARA